MKIPILIILSLFIDFSSSWAKSPVRPFVEMNGYVSFEAEDFSEQTNNQVRTWYIQSLTDSCNIAPDSDPIHASNASNGSYIELLPDTRQTANDKLITEENFSDKPGIAVVNYPVKFSTTGKYYVWVRAFSTGAEDNGLHVGIDGNWPESGQRMQWCEGKNKWTWASKQRTDKEHCGVPGLIFVEVDKPGIHTISFCMREDGFEMDKVVLTQQNIQPE